MTILEYENYQEKKSHFNSGFPYNTYPCCIPQDFLSVPLHWHMEMEIIYIKKGRGTVSVDLSSSSVQAGDIIFVAPGQLHGIFQYKQMRMEYETILFDLAMLAAKNEDDRTAAYLNPLNLSSILPKNIYTPQDDNYTQISHWIDQADEICKSFPPAYSLAIKGCLFSLFYALFSICEHVPAVQKQHLQLEKLKSVIKYVENHYQERITIEQMAACCDYSQSHFMKYFKKAMGTSFINYLNDYRLMMAARLLLSSDADILSISENVGYENLSYFNRSFKKKFGKTPSAYRNSAGRTDTAPLK